MNRTQQVNKNVTVVAWLVVLAVAAITVGYLAGGALLKGFNGKPAESAKTDQINGQYEPNDQGTAQVNNSTGATGGTDAKVTPEVQQEGGMYIVQLGAFTSQENAERLKTELSSKGFQNVNVSHTEGSLYKVQLGGVTTKEEANRLTEQIKDAGYVDVFCVH